MGNRYEGKVVVVTGAADGLGRALALGYAAEGAVLAILDINTRGLEETARMIRDTDSECATYEIDLGKEQQIEEVGKALCSAFPRIDVLFNNAAIAYGEVLGPIDSIGMDKWQKYFAVNTISPLLLSMALRSSLAAAKGCIINQSTIGSYQPSGIYGVTKSALNQITFGLAALYGSDGIRVNAIAPGMMETPASVANVPPNDYAAVQRGQMLKLHGVADDIVRLGLFLASEDARFITAEVISCDGGSRLRGWRF